MRSECPLAKSIWHACANAVRVSRLDICNSAYNGLALLSTVEISNKSSIIKNYIKLTTSFQQYLKNMMNN